MNNIQHTSNNLIEYSYNEYFELVVQYITYRITHKYDAEDLAQDVFVRLLDYKQMLRKDTVKYFIFTIARNIVTDYIRRYYKKQELDIYLYDTLPVSVNDMEEKIMVNDLLIHEKKKLSLFPQQRRIIYTLSRYQEKTIPEISIELNLSRKTVENHLFIGRKIMREFIKQSI